MKILITGADGQLGRELVKQLAGKEFLAVGRREMDVTDQTQVFKVISDYRPQVVIHCAAYTAVDAAEENRDLAYQVNALGTQNVAAACLAVQAKMAYISTDYVFDGALGKPYQEWDLPNPQTVYGKSKLAGEFLAKQILNRLYIVRTSWLYGDGPNFVRTMLRLGHERTELKVVNDQYGCPTSTVDLSQAVLRLIETESYGIYHAVNQGITTWYDFAKTIFNYDNNEEISLFPQSTAELGRPAARPAYSVLNNCLLRLVIGDMMHPWQIALAEYMGCTSLNLENRKGAYHGD